MALTDRQTRLYEFLLENDSCITQKEIAQLLYAYSFWDDDDNFHDSLERHQITDDIRALNESDEVDVLIMSTGQGIKIANETEAYIYLRSQYGSIFRRLSRIRKMQKKAMNDGQGVINFDLQWEQNFVESFLPNPKFEDGKDYVFSLENYNIWRKPYPKGKKAPDWAIKSDGKKVSKRSRIAGRVNGWGVSPLWCKKIVKED